MILLIEDDQDIRLAMEDVLTDEGYDVCTAGDGLEGLAALKNTRELPQAILLDLMMPQMDGLTFRQHMRREARYDDVPVIVISADRNGDAKVREMAVAAFLKKPLDLDDMLSLLGRLAPHAK